ncbi:hypothetical protein IMSAGC012_03124 [Lachnospiraceae bacterium]|nr:hypothetical protein IMSAGC012_03124 [Lachnospiraceae bacterium]
MIRFQQNFRQNHIADADRRADAFGKCPYVYDRSAAVIALQGRNRFSFITKFTVVIIFNDKSARLFRRPLQKLKPSLHRHYRSHRKLMRRHGIDEIRFEHAQFIHPNTAFVSVRKKYFTSHICKCPAGFLIRRIFHRNFLLFSENLRQQYQKILVSGADHHLARTAVYASRMVEITADRLPQFPFSRRLSRTKQRAVVTGQYVF